MISRISGKSNPQSHEIPMILASHVIPIAISYPFFQVPRARRIPVRRASAAAREAQGWGGPGAPNGKWWFKQQKNVLSCDFTNINLHFLVEIYQFHNFSRRSRGEMMEFIGFNESNWVCLMFVRY